MTRGDALVLIAKFLRRARREARNVYGALARAGYQDLADEAIAPIGHAIAEVLAQFNDAFDAEAKRRGIQR